MKQIRLHKFASLLFSLLLTVPVFSEPVERTELPIIQDDYAQSVKLRKKDMSQVVKIGLREDDDKISLDSEGPLVYSTTSSSQGTIIGPGKRYLTVVDGKIAVDGKPIARRVWFKPSRSGDDMSTNNMSVHGLLRARVTDGGKITLVNELSVDDYLKGVLPREVIVSWPEQALRAQAVASRTYLVTHLGRHSAGGFDLCDKVHCQVYGGKSRENPRTNEAVEATRGEILTYNGKPVQAFFHANCGGATEKVSAVWSSSDQPYLTVRKCRWDRGAPWFKWELTMSANEVFDTLKKAGHANGSKLKGLRIKEKGRSGRVSQMEIETDQGKTVISGNTFRMTFGPEKVRSMLWNKFSKSGSGYYMAGTGWGHGIGLCQWGAKGQSDEGKNYKQILSYYYPGTELSVWTR